MPDIARQLKLGAFFNPTGHHVASWRHPEADADAGINFKHYVALARMAEQAKFDMVFLADTVGVRNAKMEALSRSAQYIANFEPTTLIAALAAITERVGLVCTMSTSYNEPYHVARRIASIDHISNGRAGWNLVTSSQDSEALNFGLDTHYGHAERYRRANEFAEVVTGLWDSWDDDAFVRDKASGLFFDPDKMRVLDHHGPYFKVKGPLNIPRPPQGHPVIVQAGTSNDGIEVAARFAEVIFSSHTELPDCLAYGQALRTRAQDKFGRDPDHIKIMPGLSVYVGATETEASEKFEQQNALMHPVVAREILSTILGGIDLSGFDFDGPLPALKPNSNGSQSTFLSITNIAKRDGLTIRQLAYRVAGARAKMVIKGTPSQVADHMEHWFRTGAADGFNIMPPHLPGAFRDFVELVVPELQCRGLVRIEYAGKTLRDHFDLPRPRSRFLKDQTSMKRYGTPQRVDS